MSYLDIAPLADRGQQKPDEPLHTTQAGAYERATSKRPTAAPIVDGDAKLVALDITPHLQPLLRQVIHTLRDNQQLRIAIIGAARSNYDLYSDPAGLLRDLVDAVAKTPEALIVLAEADAGDLSEELDASAAYTPDHCSRWDCGDYTADDRTEWCESHQEAVRS